MTQPRFLGKPLSSIEEAYPFSERLLAMAEEPWIQPPANLAIIVLDDDPTGTQTVYDVPVLTNWAEQDIRRELESGVRALYLLTNSRALSTADTVTLHREVARNVYAAAQAANVPFLLVSRGDSTLRGHYPLETDTLRHTLEGLGCPPFDGEIVCPFFLQGNRYTCENVHYLIDGGLLLPVGQSEFARDSSFAYTQSDLRAYIAEKTQDAVSPEQVAVVPLEWLRAGDVEAVTRLLCSLTGYRRAVVNAAALDDLLPFVRGLWRAAEQGKRFMFRTASSLTQVMLARPARPLLTAEQMNASASQNGGLFVVGSHVAKTTRQLNGLLDAKLAVPLAFRSHLVTDAPAMEAEINRVAQEADRLISQGVNAVVYTERALMTPEGGDPDGALRLSASISRAVTDILHRLTVRPRYIVAKGGITSSDVATVGLGVRRATVLGQILPGVPVWQVGEETRFPGIPYVVFPGNVGDDGSLRAVAEIFGQPNQ